MATPKRGLAAEVAETLAQWGMLQGVKRLGVAVSGGADSLTLLSLLLEAVGDPVELKPIHIRQYPAQDSEQLSRYIRGEFGLDVHIDDSDTTGRVQRELRAGRAPCRTCAPVRRRRLASVAAELDLDAIALGHHLDDAATTLIMNMLHASSTETMRPVAQSRTNGLRVLRPLLLSSEAMVKDASPAGPDGLFDCGMCAFHAMERDRVRRFVSESFEMHGAPAVDSIRAVVKASIASQC